MAHVELVPELGDDLERILEHLSQHEVADAPTRIRGFIKGISVLEHHRLTGRPAPEDLRELIIGREARGYVALHPCVADLDNVTGDSVAT
jgi:toxin ParE1/3/4